MTIKESIIHILETHEVIKETRLVNDILSIYESIKKDDVLKNISELVQNNLIIRLEYIPPNQSYRSCIYFPFGTQIK